jgi:aryl-alcohol dehydrogenase-like predicted oxidoreductase
MRIRTLGRTGLRVSEICLGAMTAREADCTPAQLALAWQLAKPEITSVIIGARNQAQLADNLGATAVTVPPEIMDRLETASRIEPEYPGAFIDFIQGWLGNR